MVVEENKLSRFELIDDNGRLIVYYGKLEAEYQDEGRTLKVFLRTPLTKREVGFA